jgi:tRNA A22 N-methylase
MNEKIRYWIDLAEYDLETARVMLTGKRFLYEILKLEYPVLWTGMKSFTA